MDKRKASSSSSDSEDSVEKERKTDLKERDEFADRLKNRDKERTRNIVRPTPAPSDPRSSGQVDIKRLRIESRRKYLAKRKDDKIAELEADIIDDEYLFQEEILTEREKYEREHKKRLLHLAKEHEKARELEMVRRYHMPQDCKPGEMEADLDDGNELGEGKKWEHEQMLSAVFHFGSKDRPSAQEEYDLLVDQIDFIKALSMAGTEKPERDREEDEKKKKIRDIEETRRSLPIYFYKDDLVAAIKKYQVYICQFLE